MSVGVTGPFLWWKCHRASCTSSYGKHRLSGKGGSPETTDERRGRYRAFDRISLPVKLRDQLLTRYYLQPESLDRARWSYTPDYDGHGERVVMPIYSPDGRVRGENFRSYDGHLPKTLINAELKENVICWYKFKKYGKILVLVEDQPSALRLAEAGIDACSLLGTTLNLERVLEIKAQEYRRIWLCLDNDATSQSIKYMKEYGAYLPQMKVKGLDGADIKDLKPASFDLIVNEFLQGE